MHSLTTVVNVLAFNSDDRSSNLQFDGKKCLKRNQKEAGIVPIKTLAAQNDVLSDTTSLAFYLESSVTFLGDFWMFLAKNLITKVAQIYGKF